jgi:hypothetical protein
MHKINEVTPPFMFKLSKQLVLVATLQAVFITPPVAVMIAKLQPTQPGFNSQQGNIFFSF